MDSELVCHICMEIPTVPMSFKKTSPQCQQNHIFCIGCIYEYVRYSFQLHSFTGKCSCPMDRIESNLKDISPDSILEIIEINLGMMEKLDQEEKIECIMCNNNDALFARKDYWDHWMKNHFGNDMDLTVIKNTNDNHDDNYDNSLIPPEFLTDDELENQRRILEEIHMNNISREIRQIRSINPQDKEERANILKTWKNLWNESKILKKNIKNKNFAWDIQSQELEEKIEKNQNITNELFLIYAYEERPRKKNNQGDLKDYILTLNKKRLDFVDHQKNVILEHMALARSNIKLKKQSNVISHTEKNKRRRHRRKEIKKSLENKD
jgi:hypothetical protein